MVIKAESLRGHFGVGCGVPEPGIRVRREISIFAEDAGGIHTLFKLHEQTGRAEIDKQWIERLCLAQLIFAEITFAQRLLAQVEERTRQGVSTQPAAVLRSQLASRLDL